MRAALTAFKVAHPAYTNMLLIADDFLMQVTWPALTETGEPPDLIMASPRNDGGWILVEIDEAHPEKWDSLLPPYDDKPPPVLVVSKARTFSFHNGRGTEFELQLVEFLKGWFAASKRFE